jgi:hypothetical protein
MNNIEGQKRCLSAQAAYCASCCWVCRIAQGICARPKACKSEAGTTLDYNGRKSASDPRCMHTFLGQGARLPEWEVSGVDTTGHHILALIEVLILLHYYLCFRQSVFSILASYSRVQCSTIVTRIYSALYSRLIEKISQTIPLP